MDSDTEGMDEDDESNGSDDSFLNKGAAMLKYFLSPALIMTLEHVKKGNAIVFSERKVRQLAEEHYGRAVLLAKSQKSLEKQRQRAAEQVAGLRSSGANQNDPSMNVSATVRIAMDEDGTRVQTMTSPT
jgi:hypothetical protein